MNLTPILARHSSDVGAVLASRLLLLAAFFAFSFNNLASTKIYFPAGQASFFFLMAALLIGFRSVRSSTLQFSVAFLAYLFFAALVGCATGSVCTTRPLTGAVSVLLVIAVVEFVASTVERQQGLEVKIERAFVGAAWMIVIFAVPDIIAIRSGDIQSSVLESLLKSSVLRYDLEPYTVLRLRGFTQEPSYLGMVIATLYPFVLMRLEKRVSPASVLLLLGLWLCLWFSMSRTGLGACLAFTVFWVFGRARSYFLILVVGALFLGVATFAAGIDPLMEIYRTYLSRWDNKEFDSSVLIRLGHMNAALKLWLDKFLLGCGLGQSGYLLPDYYPEWIWKSEEAPKWAATVIDGGVPSFSFIPKLLAEIGTLGAALLFVLAIPLLRSLRKHWSEDYYLRVFTCAVLCFLISSFGVEGWLYMAAWLVFGVMVGLVRRLDGLAKKPVSTGGT